MKAQLAEANEKINKLSADMNEKQGESYKHHTMEAVQLQIELERKMAPLREARLGRTLLDRKSQDLEMDKVQCLTSEGVILSKKQLWRMVFQEVPEQPTLLPLWVSIISICNIYSPTIIGQVLILLSYLILRGRKRALLFNSGKECALTMFCTPLLVVHCIEDTC